MHIDTPLKTAVLEEGSKPICFYAKQALLTTLQVSTVCIQILKWEDTILSIYVQAYSHVKLIKTPQQII